jgi:hypothetical protein
MPVDSTSRVLPTMGALGGSRELCNHFCRTGKCKHGSNCKYVHDCTKVCSRYIDISPSSLQVQICRSFLREECTKSSDECSLSHELDPNRIPECGLFLRNLCINPDCKFLHIRKSPNAPECQDFLTSWCPLGVNCPKRHYVPPSSEKKRIRENDDEEGDAPPSEDEDNALQRIWNEESSLKFYM